MPGAFFAGGGGGGGGGSACGGGGGGGVGTETPCDLVVVSTAFVEGNGTLFVVFKLGGYTGGFVYGWGSNC